MQITANAVQTVAVNQNVLFTDVVSWGNCSIFYMQGSGLVTLRGITNQCRARFKVSFGANIAGVTAATPILLAIALNGEAIPSTTMIVTPPAAAAYENVSTETYIDVPSGDNMQISIKNLTTDQSVNVQNARLIVERTA